MPYEYSKGLSRRECLFRLAGGAVAFLTAAEMWSLASLAQTGERTSGPGFITRVSRPQDLESPPQWLTSWLTPNDHFFVRSHFGPPSPTNLKDWQLHLEGEVKQPLTFSISDLKTFEEVRLHAVVQCAGNGRAFFRPRVPGVQWERGAVGNAKWTGVRLGDVLKRAGLGPKAKHVRLLGADRPVLPTVPLFVRSIPIEKAMHPTTLLAYEMNGEPLPILHGAPLRLIVPGWAGDTCVKWLTHLTVQDNEADGFYMQTAYRMPVTPARPGAAIPPSEMIPVTEMPVKSLIARPLEGAKITGGEVQVEGVAFTGDGEIVRVEISMDEGKQWHDADLGEDRAPYAWRLWRYAWTSAKPGRYTIRSRATDSRGHMQPMMTPWNPSGLLWNGVDTVQIELTT
jgi:DMSO/TMAO reductase YedYZ molybdopterin-dependent catalytic subunit